MLALQKPCDEIGLLQAGYDGILINFPRSSQYLNLLIEILCCSTDVGACVHIGGHGGIVNSAVTSQPIFTRLSLV